MSKKHKHSFKFPEKWDVVPDEKYSTLEGDWPGARMMTRYVIINSETNEVIDDANGYGYKTKQNAYKAGYYKSNTNNIKSNRIAVEKFLKNHKQFADNIEWVMLDDLKCGEEFTVAELEAIAKEHNIELPIRPDLFLKYIRF